MSDGMGRELAYLSSHATNRYFIPNWGKDLSSFLKSNPYPIESSQYAIQQAIAYTLFASTPSMFTHAPRKEAFICGALER